MKTHLIILCTCPDQTSARRIADRLVEARLAACVNLVPGVTSVYEWQGKIETSQEWLLLIKSHTERYAVLQEEILVLHPYELPEILALSIEDGLPDYLRWIDQCVGLNP